MPTFFPPVDQQVGPIQDYWGNVPADAEPSALAMAKYLAPLGRGRNVYLMNDGSVTEVQPPNWDGSTSNRAVNAKAQEPYAWSFTYIGGSMGTGVTTFTNPPNQQVLRVFLGGHVNQISAADMATLLAAGYPASDFGP